MDNIFLTKGEDLTEIAHAIRAKSGNRNELAFPDDFISAIASIDNSGNSEVETCTVYFSDPDDILAPMMIEKISIAATIFQNGSINSFFQEYTQENYRDIVIENVVCNSVFAISGNTERGGSNIIGTYINIENGTLLNSLIGTYMSTIIKMPDNNGIEVLITVTD